MSILSSIPFDRLETVTGYLASLGDSIAEIEKIDRAHLFFDLFEVKTLFSNIPIGPNWKTDREEGLIK